MDFFQLLAVLNKAAINIYMSLYGHVLSFLLSKYLGVKWLNHMVSICLTF